MSSPGDASLRTEKVAQKASDVDEYMLQKARQLIHIEAKLSDLAIDIERNELDPSQVPHILRNLSNIVKSGTAIQDKCASIVHTAKALVESLKCQHGGTSSARSRSDVPTSEAFQEEGKDKTNSGEVEVGLNIDDTDDVENPDVINLRLQTGHARKGTASADSGIALSTGSIPSSALSVRLQDVMQEGENAPQMNDLNREESVSDEDNNNTPPIEPVEPQRASTFLRTLKPTEQEFLNVQGLRSFKRTQGATKTSRDPPMEQHEEDRSSSVVAGQARATSLPSDLMRHLSVRPDASGVDDFVGTNSIRDSSGRNDNEDNSSVVTGQSHRTSLPVELDRDAPSRPDVIRKRTNE